MAESSLPIERSIVAYSRDHDDAVGGDLPDLVDERLVGEVGPADAQVQDVHLLQDGVVERVQEPRGERRLSGGGGDALHPWQSCELFESDAHSKCLHAVH